MEDLDPWLETSLDLIEYGLQLLRPAPHMAKRRNGFFSFLSPRHDGGGKACLSLCLAPRSARRGSIYTTASLGHSTEVLYMPPADKDGFFEVLSAVHLANTDG
jgi:hypothetical protein